MTRISLFTDPKFNGTGKEEPEETLAAPLPTPSTGRISLFTDDTFAAPPPSPAQALRTPPPTPQQLGNPQPVGDFKTSTEFAQLYRLRRDADAARMLGGTAAKDLGGMDTTLMQQISEKYGVTSIEVGDALEEIERQRAGTQRAQTEAQMASAQQAATTYDPNAGAEASRASQLTREVFGGAARMAGDTIEPFLYPQQVLMEASVALNENSDKPLGEKLKAIRQNVAAIDEGAYFDSLNFPKYWSGKTKQAPRLHTGEDVFKSELRAMGMREDALPEWVNKTAGIGLDLFYDPLVFGSMIRSTGGILSKTGKLTKNNSLVQAGADAVRAGDTLERALSPVGIAGGVTRAVPKHLRDAIGERMDKFLDVTMNTPVDMSFSRFKMGDAAGKNPSVPTRTLAELFAPKGVLRKNGKDVLTGAHSVDEIRLADEAGVAVEEMFPRPVSGTARPFELQDSMARGEYVADVASQGVNEGFARIYSALGNDRAAKYLRDGHDNFVKLRQIIDDPKFNRYDTETRDMLQILGLDTARNMGISQLRENGRGPESILGFLDAQRQVNNTNRNAWNGRSALEDTVGGEVRKIVGEAPQAMSLVYRDSLQKLRKHAERKGLDAKKVETDFEDFLDGVIGTDMLMGYHNSMYGPIKDTFYEEVARRGGSFEQAKEGWQKMIAAATRGEDAGAIGFDESMNVVQSYGLRGYNDAPRKSEVMETIEVEKNVLKKGRIQYDEAGNPITELVEKERNVPIALTSGDLLRNVTEGMGLDLNPWLRDSVQGHLRSDYAAFQAVRDPERWKAALRGDAKGRPATALRAPIMHQGAYRGAMKSAGFEKESDLIAQYFENIAPMRRGERGLVVRTTNVAQHLLDSGIPKDRVNAAMAKLLDEVTPQNMDITGPMNTSRMVNYVDIKADQTSGGNLFASQRMDAVMPPKSRQVPVFAHRQDLTLADTEKSILPARLPAATRRVAEKEIRAEDGELMRIQREMSKLDPVGDSPTLQTLTAERNTIIATRQQRNKGYEQYINEADDALLARNMQDRERELSFLGQIYDPLVNLGQGTEHLRRHYPTKQFLLDAYTTARRGGYIDQPRTTAIEGRRVLASTPDNVPSPNQANQAKDNYVWVSPEEGLGPFSNTYVHRQIYNEVKNAVLADNVGRMSSLGRVASAVSAGKLASPKSIINNTIGALYISDMYGNAAADVIGELPGLLKDLKKYGGKTNLPEMDEVGHLMGGSSKLYALARMVDDTKIDLSGIRGAQELAPKLTQMYSEALKHPLGQSWAGLDWFQASEDLMKLANHRVAKKRMGVDEAIEHTRNVMFDYTRLPESIRMLRDHGVMTFPAFPLFTMSRTITGMMQRPGTLGFYDRTAEAAWNIAIDDEEAKHALAANMNDYQFDNRSVPVFIRDGDGGEIFSMIGMGAYAPTNILDRDNLRQPITENLGGLGWGRAFIDVLAASRVEGEAVFGQRFGQRVYDAERSLPMKVGQTGAYLGQQFAPALIAPMMNYNPNRTRPDDGFGSGSQHNFGGLLPHVFDYAAYHLGPVPKEVKDKLAQVREAQADRVERTTWEEIAGLVMPTPNPVSLEQKTANFRRKESGYEVETAKEVDMLQRRETDIQEGILAGTRTQDELAANALAQQNAGKTAVTMPDGSTARLPQSTLDLIATGLYWQNYNNRNGGQ